MLNLVFCFEQSNVEKINEAFSEKSRNCFVNKGSSEAALIRFLLDLGRQNLRRPGDIKLMAVRGEETRFFRINEVYYFESQGKLMKIWNAEGNFEFYSTLARIDQKVTNLGFCRVHNSYIVSLKHIRCCTKSSIIMDDGREIPIGRRFEKDYRRAVRNSGFHMLN